MDTFLSDMISRIDLLDAAILAAGVIVLAYCAFSNRLSALMFLLVLSTTLVVTTIPVIEAIASLARWASLLLLLVTGLIFSRTALSAGLLFFWGYVFLGLISMFRALSITWQLQRGLLLLLVALAVPIGYGSRSYRTHRATLILIAMVAALFALLNVVALPGQLTGSVRSIGISKAAPALAVTLGGLLPFLLWGSWRVQSKGLRTIFWASLLAALATLILSAQRTGTIAGIVSLIPLTVLLIKRSKGIGWLVLLAATLALLAFVITHYASADKLNFLLSRYRFDSGLSGRDWIWRMALSEIGTSPLFGRGLGAAEWVRKTSFHNAYLEIWFNTGLIGLGLFLASQVYFLVRIGYLGRMSTDAESKSVLALALGYLLGFVVLCSFESVGAGASNLNVVLYLYLGVLISSGALFEIVSPPLTVAVPGSGSNLNTGMDHPGLAASLRSTD